MFGVNIETMTVYAGTFLIVFKYHRKIRRIKNCATFSEGSK